MTHAGNHASFSFSSSSSPSAIMLLLHSTGIFRRRHDVVVMATVTENNSRSPAVATPTTAGQKKNTNRKRLMPSCPWQDRDRDRTGRLAADWHCLGDEKQERQLNWREISLICITDHDAASKSKQPTLLSQLPWGSNPVHSGHQIQTMIIKLAYWAWQKIINRKQIWNRQMTETTLQCLMKQQNLLHLPQMDWLMYGAI